MAALALISDLMTQSQAAGAAARAGVAWATVGTADGLLAKTQAEQPRLVIIDLSHPGLDVAALVGQLRGMLPAKARIVAFGPHVHKERLAAAEAAGCDQVMSRGQFHAQGEALLREWGS